VTLKNAFFLSLFFVRLRNSKDIGKQIKWEMLKKMLNIEYKLRQVVNLTNVKRTNISYKRRFGSFFLCTHEEQKLSKWHSYEKSSQKNVDEIDQSSQSHQHYTSSFCANILSPKNYNAKL